MSKLNILIAILAYGGSVKSACVMSVFKLVQYFRSNGISWDLSMPDITGIDIARSVVGSFVFAEKRFTHLLFIDHDIIFEPSAVEKMLRSDKPLLGAVYPKRMLNLPLALNAAKSMETHAAIAKASDFNVYINPGSPPVSTSVSICRVDGIGMGLTLIARSVFEQMVGSGKLRSGRKHPFQRYLPNSSLYFFFEQIVTDNDVMSEDISFCMRWAQLCSGETWAVVDETIGHRGEFTYDAKIWDGFGA